MKGANKSIFLNQIYKPILGLALLVMPFVLIGGISYGNNHLKNTNSSVAGLDIGSLVYEVLLLNETNQRDRALSLICSNINERPQGSSERAFLIHTFNRFLKEELYSQKNAIKLDQKNIKAYIKVAKVFEVLGERFAALETITSGASKNPSSVRMWLELARLELKSGRKIDALDIYKEVIRLEPTNSEAYNYAAFLISELNYSSIKHLHEARSYAEKAVQFDPGNQKYINTLAKIRQKFIQGKRLQGRSSIIKYLHYE